MTDKILEILKNPTPQTVVDFQAQTINQLQAELTRAKVNIEDLVNYAMFVEQELKKAKERIEELEETPDLSDVDEEVSE